MLTYSSQIDDFRFKSSLSSNAKGSNSSTTLSPPLANAYERKQLPRRLKHHNFHQTSLSPQHLGKACIRARWSIRPALISGFCGMKRLGEFLLPPQWMGCQSITGLPSALNLPVPIYTPGWREALKEFSVLPKNTTQQPWPGMLCCVLGQDT